MAENYKARFECASGLVRKLIQEDSDKNELIVQLQSEIRILKEEVEEKVLTNDGDNDILKSSLESRFNPYHDKKGRFTSGMHVRLPDGKTGRLANDGIVIKIVQIAGDGVKNPVKVAEGLSLRFHNKPSDWSKFRGDGYVTYPDGTTKHVEVHWFLSKQNDIVNFKVKREF